MRPRAGARPPSALCPVPTPCRTLRARERDRWWAPAPGPTHARQWRADIRQGTKPPRAPTDGAGSILIRRAPAAPPSAARLNDEHGFVAHGDRRRTLHSVIGRDGERHAI